MHLDILALLPKGYTPVYFLIALIAGLGYAIQGLLVANYGRRFDPLLVTACRGLSFTITLSPLLLLAPSGSLENIMPHIATLLLGGFFGALAVSLIFLSQRYFPVGIVAAFQQMSQLWLLFFGYLFLQERIGSLSLLAVLLIVAGVVALALQKNRMSHLKEVSLGHFSYVFLFPLLLALGYFFLASVTRFANALTAGYIWEIFIGMFGLLLYFLKKSLYLSVAKEKHAKFNTKDAFFIGIFASGTLLGTGGQVILYTLGSAGIGQTAVSSLQMVFMAILGALFFHERLKIGQWLAIFVIIGGIVALKVVTE